MADRILPVFPTSIMQRRLEGMDEANRQLAAFIAGITDSRFFRERGIPAYGVSPFKIAGEDSLGIHGPDERIPLAELDRGVERTRRLLLLYAASR